MMNWIYKITNKTLWEWTALDPVEKKKRVEKEMKQRWTGHTLEKPVGTWQVFLPLQQKHTECYEACTPYFLNEFYMGFSLRKKKPFFSILPRGFESSSRNLFVLIFNLFFPKVLGSHLKSWGYPSLCINRFFLLIITSVDLLLIINPYPLLKVYIKQTLLLKVSWSADTETSSTSNFTCPNSSIKAFTSTWIIVVSILFLRTNSSVYQ